MGATFTAVATQGNQIYFAQVGDSRAHLIRKGKIYRVTKDQSLVQQLIDAGQITEEEAETHSYRNVILQALGAHNNVNVEVNTVALCQLDTLVLCSDGLSGKMHADEIARIVNEAGDFKSACQSLINLANERGGEDNITVVVAQFSGAGLPLPDTDSVVPTSLARSPDTPTEINWTMGAKTDPLDDLNSASPRSPSGEARKTEPLPPPPKQSTPFTTPLTRPSSERSRTNDLSDRVGPITAVFAPEEFEEDSRTTAEQKNPNPTTPLDSRYTKPISASPSQPMPEPNAAATPSLSNGQNGVRSASKSSKANLAIFTGLVLLVVAGLVISATLFFKQRAEEKSAQKIVEDNLKAEKKDRKESQVKRLREKIAEIDKNIQAVDKPTSKEKRDRLMQSLEEQGRRLDEVDQVSEDQLPKITEICDEISKKLKEIEDELKSLQGLLPLRLTSRAPVKL